MQYVPCLILYYLTYLKHYEICSRAFVHELTLPEVSLSSLLVLWPIPFKQP